MKTVREYLPESKDALTVLGGQIAEARRRLGWTAAELADRVGVSAPVISRIENGSGGTQIGTVFDAAVLCGVPLFSENRADLGTLKALQQGKVALLPHRVLRREFVMDNDF